MSAYSATFLAAAARTSASASYEKSYKIKFRISNRVCYYLQQLHETR